jgi:hypothetical protein
LHARRPSATPASLIGLLAYGARLRVVAALALGAARRATCGPPPVSVRGRSRVALHRLGTGGLVSTVDGELRLHAELFYATLRRYLVDADC